MDTHPAPAGSKNIFVDSPLFRTVIFFDNVPPFLNEPKFFSLTSAHFCGQ